MSTVAKLFYLLIVASTMMFCGCAAPDPYYEEREHSHLPWTLPAENFRHLPGMSPGY